MASMRASLKEAESIRPGRSRSKFGRSSNDFTAEEKVLMLIAERACFGLEVGFVVFLRVVAIACVGYQKLSLNSNRYT